LKTARNQSLALFMRMLSENPNAIRTSVLRDESDGSSTRLFYGNGFDDLASLPTICADSAD